jgi:RHS repeat-associated protein
MKLKIVRSFFLLALLALSVKSFATQKTWIGTTSTWSVSSNWSGGTPGVNDTAIFTNGANCSITSAISVQCIWLTSTYSATVTQSASITAGAGGFIIDAGTFTGGSSTIIMNGPTFINGGTFTSTSGTLNLYSDFTYTAGTFNHNSGTVSVNADMNLSGTQTFNNLSFTSSGIATTTAGIVGTLTVNGTLAFGSGNGIQILAGGHLNTGNIHANGNITSSGSVIGGTAIINITGSGNQTLTGSGGVGGDLTKVVINKSGGTLTLSSTITVLGSWTYTAGTISAGSSVVYFSGTATVSGSHTLNTVTFNNTATISSGTTLTLSGNLNVAGTSAYSINTGTINVAGNITVTDTASGGGGSATININGTGSQSLTQSGINQGNYLPNVIINKSSGTLTLASGKTVWVNGNWTYTAGTVTTTSSTVVFKGTSPTIDGNHTLNNVTLAPTGASTVTIASGKTLTVAGTLKYAGSSAITVNTGTINPTGNVTITNTVTTGGGNATILFNGTASQTVTGLSAPGLPLSKILINKTGGTLTFTNTIVASSDWIYSATSTTLATTGSTIVFTGASPTIDGTHTLNNVTFAPTSPSTVTIASGKTLTVGGTLTYGGTAALTVNTGTINPTSHITVTNTVTTGGGSAIINITGSNSQTFTGLSSSGLPLSDIVINKSGGTLTFTNTITAGGNWTWTAGTLATTGSTINFTGTTPTIDGNHTLNNVTFSPAVTSTITIASGKTLTVGGTLTYGGTAALTVNTGTINPTSHITVTNTVTTGGGSAIINITGGNSQTFTGLSSSGLPLSNIVINKSGGTLTFTNTITAAGNWTWTAGTLATTGSTINFIGNTPTIDGTHTLNNVTFSPSSSSTVTIASGKTLTVGGTLTYAGTAGLIVNTGTINPTSHITVTNTVTTGGGSATINITGSNSQTFTGLSSSGLPLCNVVINKSGGTLTFTNTITAGGNWTWTAGTLASSGSTIAFAGTSPTIAGSHTLNNIIFAPTAASTVTVSNSLTLNGDLNYNNQNAITVNTGTINVAGNITVTDTASGGGGNALININGSGTQTLTQSGVLQGNNLPNLTINKTGTLTLASGKNIWMGGNWIYTTAGTLTTSGSTVIFKGTSPTIAGTHTLTGVSFSPTAASTVTISNALTVSGTLTYNGSSNAITVNTGTINLTGNLITNNTASTGGGSTLLNITGTGTQTATGYTTTPGPLGPINISKTGGTLTLSNSLNAGGDWTYSASSTTLTPGSSTVVFTKTSPTITGTHTLNNISFSPTAASTVTIANALTVSGTLTYNGTSNAITVNTGTINVTGNLTTNNTASSGGGSTLLNFSGTGTQTLTGYTTTPGPLGPITITKTGGTLTFSNTINAGGDWTYSASSTTLTPGSSTVIFSKTSPTISGSHTLNTITFAPTAASTVTVSNALSLNGDLNYNNQNIITVNTGTINVAGNITVADTASGGGGNALININGSSTQTITQSGVLQGNSLPSVTINKTGTLVLTNNKNIWVKGNWTYTTAGAITTTGSTVVFTGTTPTITGNHTLNSLAVVPSAASTVTIASSNTLTLTGTLGFYGSSAIVINTGTISTSGHINIYNTSTGSTFGNATIVMNGTGTQTLSCSTGAPIISNLTINKSSGTLTVSGSNIAIGGNLIRTAGTVSVDTNSKISFYGNANVNAAAITFGNVDIAGGTRTLAADLNIYKTLHILDGKKLDASGTAYNVNMQGDWNNHGTFASGTGYVYFTGTKSQTITETSGDTISKLKINKAAGNVTLSSSAIVTDSLIFVKGNLITTSTNLLTLNKRVAVLGGGASTGFISGPVTKVGNTQFTFPTGKGTNYQPIKISAPASATDAFTGEFFGSGQTLGSVTDTTITGLSSCEYWNLARTTGTSSVSVTAGWNASSCNVTTSNKLIEMRIAYWNSSTSKWNDAGGINLTGNTTGGTVTSSSALANFGNFTLANEGYHPLILVYTKQDIEPGQANNSGNIIVSGQNGLPPYKYKWENDSTYSERYNLSPGAYSVTMVDSLRDTVRQTITVGSLPTILTKSYMQSSATAMSFTNTGVGTSEIGSVTFDNLINANEDGWMDFKLADTTSYFYLGYQPQTEDSLPPISGKSNVETINKYISRASMAGHSALLATYDTLSSSYSDSIRVVCRRCKNGSAVMTTAYGVGFGHNQFFVFVAGQTYQRPIIVNPGDVFRVGRSSGTLYVNRNAQSLTIEGSSINSIPLSPQLYLKGSSVTLGNFVGLYSNVHLGLTLGCLSDINRNYVENITYDESGAVISDTKIYYDYIGRTIQSQAMLLSQNNVLVTQSLFDGFGRAVGQTLPAPNNNNTLCYQSNFVPNNYNGNPYIYSDFDNPYSSNAAGEINNPKSVGNSTSGTLGWYYSDNNTSEPFADKSGIPYNRVEYYPDPLNRPKRTAGVGDNHKMGSGHENRVFYMVNAGELDYFYGYQGTYELNSDYTKQSVSNNNILLHKTVTVNPDGKEDISYSNSSGNVVAACVSGNPDTCITQKVTQPINYYTSGAIPFHLPLSKNGKLKFTAAYTQCSEPYSPGGNFCDYVITKMDDVVYHIEDLNTGHMLVLNTDYSINSTTRAVTFAGSYASKSLYLNISYSVIGIGTVDVMPALTMEYELDYSNWTLNYNDSKGRAIANVAPADINCSGQQVAVNVIHQDKTQSAVYNGCGNSAYSYSVPGSLFNNANGTVSYNIVPILTSNTYSQRMINQQNVFSQSMAARGFSSIPIDTFVVSPDTSLIRQITNNPSIFNNLYADTAFKLNPYYYKADSTGTVIDSLKIMDSSTGAITNADYYSRLQNASSAVLTYTLQYDVVLKNGSGTVISTPIQNSPTTVTIDVGGNVLSSTGNILVSVTSLLNSAFISTSDLASAATIQFIPHDISFNVTNYPTSYGVHYYDATWFDWCTVSGSVGSSLPTGVDALDWYEFINAPDNYFQLAEHITLNNYATSTNQHTLSKKVTYDDYNRVASTTTADEGETDFVYNNEDKLRFSQNDKQRLTGSGGKFTYVDYDRAGRPVETGEYDPTITGCGGCFNPYYFRTWAQYNGSTNAAPSGHTDVFADITSGYDILTGAGRTYQRTMSLYDTADVNLSSAVTGYNQTHLSSKVSKTWNDYSISWYSYDELGRLIWTVQQTNDAILSYPFKTYNYTYDMQGKVLQTAYNKENSSEDFYHKFDYDMDQRLTQVSTSTDGTTWTSQDKYYYYLHGPLKREEIQTTLQGIDYVYTINGMLKSINHPSLNNLYDPGQDSKSSTTHSAFKNDVFGFALDYYTNDYTRSSTNVQSYSGGTNLYGGTIKSARWQTQFPSSGGSGLVFAGGEQLLYKYEYDDLYRLSSANFGTYTGSTGSITYTGLSDFKLDNLSYDRNGNIQTLRRYAQNISWPGLALTMDDLTYTYDGTKKNRLKQVSDAQAGAPLSPDIDLPDQSSSSNYTYNEIGQVTANAQDGTTTDYDVYGQVSKVYKTSGGNKIARFVYNDKGLRAAKISYNSSGYKATQLNYMYDAAGSLVATYQTTFNTSTPDSTSYTTALQDYVVYGASRLGTYDVGSTTNYYEMSDHLGNVRAVYFKNGSGNAEVASFTDYYPHGGAMPGRNYVNSPTYRYAYNGQEKDAETGLLNFELRQFDARLGRWFAPDPMGQHHSPYLAMGNNPVCMVDPSGGIDFSWMAGMSEYHNNNPEGLHLGYGAGTPFSQNGMGDGFFATDAHFFNTDWTYNAERRQSSSDAQQGYHSAMHDYLVLKGNYYNEGNGQWGYMYEDDGNYKDAFQPSTGKHSGTLSLAELFVTDASSGGWTTKSEDFFTISTFSSSNDLYRQAQAIKNLAENFTKIIAANRQGGNITPDYSFDGGAVLGAWARAAVGAIAARFTSGVLSKGSNVLYHYTPESFANSISQGGLRTSSNGFLYTTTEGGLSPIQAQINLALSPNRGLPNALFRIDAQGLENIGIRPFSGPRAVTGGNFGAGGGTEVLFNRPIPAQYLIRIK